jgi:hypothetical protein
MNRSGKFLGLGCVAALLLAVAGAPLGAQAPAQPPADQQNANPQADKRPVNEQERRKQIQERVQKFRDRCDQALKALAEGKSVEEVQQTYPELTRFLLRAEGGRRQGGGPDETDPDRLGPNFMGGRQGDRPGQPEQPHVMTAEERQAVRDVLAVTSPSFLTHLQDLEKTNQAEADQKYAESFRRLRYLLELQKRDKKLYEYRLNDIKHGLEASEAASAIAELDSKHSTDTNERSKHEAALRTALTAQYTVRTQAMQREAEGLKERSATMLADSEKRDAQMSTVVEKNMKAMIDREKKKLEKHSDKDRHGGPGGPPPSGDHKPGDKPEPPPS